MKNAHTLAAASLAAGALLLSGCSSDTTTTSPTSAAATLNSQASPSASVAAQPEPVCDKPSLRGPSRAYLQAGGETKPIKSLSSIACVSGWAVTVANVRYGEDVLGKPVILKAENGAWVGQAPEAVCGTIDANDPSTRPADAQVPEPLWITGCASE